MLKNKISSFFNNGNERSIRAKKNIIAMIFLKGLSILISLLLVPMTIDYVDVETYGVWLTLSSVVAWMSFFDIGLNNGLKNRFAEAKACGNINLAQRYVSTTYAMLCLIFIPLFILFTLANRFVNWAKVFNINGIAEDELAFVMLIIVGYFCIKFIISTINVILTADQKPAAATLRVLMENIASLLVILVLKETTDGSLENLCLAICITPLIVVSLFSIQLYRGKYANKWYFIVKKT